MVTARATIEFTVESLERSLLEWRNGSQTQLNEIKRPLKGKNREYNRDQSRRERTPSLCDCERRQPQRPEVVEEEWNQMHRREISHTLSTNRRDAGFS